MRLQLRNVIERGLRMRLQVRSVFELKVPVESVP